MLARTLIVVLFITISLFPQEFSPEGKWLGTLDINGMKLRIVFNISLQKDGSFKTLLDSPDQGAEGIPSDKTTFEKGMLTVSMKAIGAEFSGKYNKESELIEGMFLQGGMTLPLTIKRTDVVEKPKRPQTPQPPFPYISEEVQFRNEAAGIMLAGTLTIPEGDGPFPAVVLVTGSGPQDRDESLMGHKPFWVIADHLSRNGIAVLRYDDRGTVKSEGNFNSATSFDFAGDAEAALAYLESRKEINKSKTGVAGHSEGGLIAAILGVESKRLDFIVSLAGPGLTGEQIIYMQTELIGKANGVSDEHLQRELALMKQLFAVVKAEPDMALAEKKLRELFNEHIAGLPEEEKGKSEYTDGAITQQIARVNTAWFRKFLLFDPVPYLEKTTVPVLALIGEKDLQVPSKENLAAIEKALKKGGNKNFVVKEMAGLNHLFQKTENGSPAEYAKIEETVSPVVLQTMTEWIKNTTAK